MNKDHLTETEIAMYRLEQEFINNFSEYVQDINLLKKIYERAFLDGVAYTLTRNLER